MRRVLIRLIEKYLSPELDFRVRLFNALAMTGVMVSLFVTVASILNGESFGNVIMNMSSGAVAYGLLRYASKTGRYQQCYMITVIGIFIVLFSIIFFIGGGYFSSMPYYLIFAVVFTALMLEGKRALIMMFVEMIIYCGLFAGAYLWPETVTKLQSERAVVIDLIIGFFIVCTALGLTVFLQFRLYNKQQRMLAEQNVYKTRFLSNISHELKTPLTVIRSHIQYVEQSIMDHPEAEDVQRVTKLIGSEAEHLALMVSQLLDISRIDEGRMQIELREESMIEIIQAALDRYYPVFSKRHNKLIFRPEGEVPPVHCDRTRISQVLVNLISNAAGHTWGGEISVLVKSEGGNIVVQVKDNGEGIAKERLPYLFDRYYSHMQREVTSTGRDTGTGLGLHICKYIIESHQGRIWIESRLGHGTDVFFTLPLDTVPAERDNSAQ